MRETIHQKQKRAANILGKLQAEYPDARCHLKCDNPFQLLISTILAAQCTDERVNLVMGELYKKYKSPADFAHVQEEKLMEELKSINFYRNKAKSVKNCCITLVEKFGGEVPKTIDKLTSLPGVGRKTANVILGNCFGVPAIITDTHLIRVSQKLGLTEKTDPDKIEMELKEIIPRDKQTLYSHVIGEHGRKVCKGRKPLCTECVVCKSCPSSEA